MLRSSSASILYLFFIYFSLLLIAVTVSFQESSSSIEEGSSEQLCCQLSSGAEIPVVVTLLVNDGTAQLNMDFILSTQVLIFQPGEILICVAVSATNDSTLEEDEVFTLDLQSSNSDVLTSPIASTTTVTIPNQDSK